MNALNTFAFGLDFLATEISFLFFLFFLLALKYFVFLISLDRDLHKHHFYCADSLLSNDPNHNLPDSSLARHLGHF